VKWERLEGLVLDDGERPVNGAMVSVVEATAPVPEIALVTDDDGRFGFGVRPGTYRLQATAADGRRGTAVWSSERPAMLVITVR
jgi:protocatechuate 3,4-dioxygenase beta subunit